MGAVEMQDELIKEWFAEVHARMMARLPGLSSQIRDLTHEKAVSKISVVRLSHLHLVLRWIAALALLWIVAILGGISFIFLRSDIQSFRPKLPGIRVMIDEQRAAVGEVPEALVRCLCAGPRWSTPESSVVRMLLSQCGYLQTTNVRRIIRELCWLGSLR